MAKTSLVRPAGSRALRRRLARHVALDPSRKDLLSYLFFDHEFIEGAIRLGQHDAQRALDATGQPVWHLLRARQEVPGGVT